MLVQRLQIPPHHTSTSLPLSTHLHIHTHLQEILSFEGFFSPVWKRVLYIVLGICTFGIVFLLAKWSSKVAVFLRLSRCALHRADWVKVTVRCAIGGGACIGLRDRPFLSEGFRSGSTF